MIPVAPVRLFCGPTKVQMGSEAFVQIVVKSPKPMLGGDNREI